MPTTYTDQFYAIDPYTPPASGTALTVFNYTLTDQDDDGDIEAGDIINGSPVDRSYPGDTVTMNLVGGGTITFTGITFYLDNGQVLFTPTDDGVLFDGTLNGATGVVTQGPLDIVDLGPPCFVSGTLIKTKTGYQPVEYLKVGDLVMTLDRGLQPLQWVGQRSVQGVADFAPIRFMAGAIGNDRELLVSPQHRILLAGWQAEMWFGQDEVLVAAKHLVNGDTIHVAPRRVVSYHHILFDRHEVVLSEGCATESFFPGDHMLEEDKEIGDEIFALFPELMNHEHDGLAETARTVLKGYEARVLQAVA